MEWLLSWDTEVFLFLNGLHCEMLDPVMWWISGNFTFIPLYIVIVILVCIRSGKRKALFIALGVILCIVLADRISSGLIKPAVERLRPSHEPQLEGLVHILREYRGGRYGFLSSHAANHFVFAVYSLLLVRRRWYTVAVIALASIISYSRIYLGVHYPLDVLCGAALGALIGFGVHRLYRTADTIKFKNSKKASQKFVPLIKSNDLCRAKNLYTYYTQNNEKSS
jgi:undecaprenyl-diphosphatase